MIGGNWLLGQWRGRRWKPPERKAPAQRVWSTTSLSMRAAGTRKRCSMSLLTPSEQPVKPEKKRQHNFNQGLTETWRRTQRTSRLTEREGTGQMKRQQPAALACCGQGRRLWRHHGHVTVGPPLYLKDVVSVTSPAASSQSQIRSLIYTDIPRNLLQGFRSTKESVKSSFYRNNHRHSSSYHMNNYKELIRTMHQTIPSTSSKKIVK